MPKTIERAFRAINCVELRYGMRFPARPMSIIKEVIPTACFALLKLIWQMVKRQGDESSTSPSEEARSSLE
jgi:hypothetical protein